MRHLMPTLTLFLISIIPFLCVAADPATVVIPKITKPLVEPADGDPLQVDYDKMWAEYEDAVDKATNTLKEALDKQTAKATDSGELDLVEMWEGMQKRFAEQGQLEWDTSSKASVEWKKANPKVPYPREFNDAVGSASSSFASAKEKLQEGYADLVKAYTKAKHIPRAKELRDEGIALIAGTLVPSQTSDKGLALGSTALGGPKSPGKDKAATVTPVGGRDAAEEAAFEKKRCLVTFSISETGDCVLRVQRAATAVGETSSSQRKDGSWVFKHVFAKPSDLDVFEGVYGPVLNARVDKNQRCLLFQADTVKGADKKISQVTYPQKFRVPFEVAVDLSATGNQFLFQLQPLPVLLGQRQALVNIKSSDAFANKVLIEVASMTRDAQGKPTFGPHLMQEETVSLNEPWEKRFRLPVPNVRSRDAYVLRCGTLGESAVEVASLTIAGVPLPSIGIKLGEKDGIVFAESVVPDSLAEGAGVETGDVINAIRGKPVSSVNEAVERLSELPYNESSEITIQRAAGKKTIRVTPKFNK